MSLQKELQKVQFSSFPEIYQSFAKLSEKYGNLPAESIISAFARIGKSTETSFDNNPYLQNKRAKGISSLPIDFTKDEVAEMIRNPYQNEKPLRQVAHGIEYTAYPMFHVRKTYQELLTYHNYVVPAFNDKNDSKNKDFWREWRLVDNIRSEMEIKSCAHKIVGQALVEGKVFYMPRVSVDKSHNKVNYSFLQQLPSDWVKIVGFNNISGYTLAFNLFYFLQPGTNVYQYGNLFMPYMRQFREVLKEPTATTERTYIYATKKPSIDLYKFRKMTETEDLLGNPEVYSQNGSWFYWVTLPIDKVFTFEVDDVSPAVVSPFTGLMLSMVQIAQYENIQLSLVQNPLTSLLTGEIPYRDDSSAAIEDVYKLSNSGRNLFTTLWYQMLAENNTGGIGIYMAPLANMQLHTLAEAPSAIGISSAGYEYTIDKAGLTGIIPHGDTARAGVAQISYAIESKFAEKIYCQFEKMMKVIYQSLNLKYEWKFVMFGNLKEDSEKLQTSLKGMTMGILPDTITYLALQDKSILDDLAISKAVIDSGIMDLRQPLITSYSAKNTSELPPTTSNKTKENEPTSNEGEAKKLLNPGGRPSSDGKATSEGQESDIDTE